MFLYQKADVGYDTGRRMLLWKSGPTLPVTPLLAERGAGLFRSVQPTRLRSEITMTKSPACCRRAPALGRGLRARAPRARPVGERDPWVEAGYGHFAGVLLVALLLRVQDLVGMRLAFVPVAVVLALVAVAAGVMARRSGRRTTVRRYRCERRPARDPLARGPRARTDRAARRTLAVEVLLRPLFAWDAGRSGLPRRRCGARCATSCLSSATTTGSPASPATRTPRHTTRPRSRCCRPGWRSRSAGWTMRW